MKATWDGFTYVLDDPIFEWHINNGKSEPYPRELAIVQRYLDEYPTCTNTCVDVGGHIGTTSLPYSRLFKHVIAFEPNPVSYGFFAQNITNNSIDNITLFNKGVFNKTTTCMVCKHGENSGCYYIKECDKNEKSIDTVKLDDIDYKSPVDFIKIDTEGSELYVLEGASETIAKYKPLVQVETNSCSANFFGYQKERIMEFMKQNNYGIFDTDGNNPLFYSK
jgi:FkbM family methyltransferase